MIAGDADADVLTVSAHGYGKRTPLGTPDAEEDDNGSDRRFRRQTRGGKGILAMKTTDKTGPLVSLKAVQDDDQLMIATEAGLMVRIPVAGISTYGRNTQGVRVINLREHDAIADVARVVADDEDDEVGEPPAEA
jgi:DNA gyrase subunit A